MKRTPILALGVLVGALLAAGCGSSSASDSPTSTSAASKITPLEWLTTNAKDWNATLNGDQARVAAAAAATSGVSGSDFFALLTSKCTQLRDDARRAMDSRTAPTAALEDAWQSMLSATVNYASKCLELAHSSSTNDVNAWQDSLTAMNNANAKFNQVANAAAKSTGSSSTTTTPPSG